MIEFDYKEEQSVIISQNYAGEAVDVEVLDEFGNVDYNFKIPQKDFVKMLDEYQKNNNIINFKEVSMNKKIYYIETTLNGYITKKIEICDWVKNKDYMGKLKFEYYGDIVEYYEDIAGDYDDLDIFLSNADSTKCENYDDILGGKPNVYLENWLTIAYSFYRGLMIA